MTSLPLITKYVLPEISEINSLHALRRSALRLDDIMTDTHIIHCNQTTTTVSRLGQGRCIAPLVSLEISNTMLRGGKGGEVMTTSV